MSVFSYVTVRRALKILRCSAWRERIARADAPTLWFVSYFITVFYFHFKKTKQECIWYVGFYNQQWFDNTTHTESNRAWWKTQSSWERVLWRACLPPNVTCRREWVKFNTFMTGLIACSNNINVWAGPGNKYHFGDRKLDNKFAEQLKMSNFKRICAKKLCSCPHQFILKRGKIFPLNSQHSRTLRNSFNAKINCEHYKARVTQIVFLVKKSPV